MIKACIFDLDGTIVDSVKSLAYSANRALAEVGLGPNPEENYKLYAGDGQFELVKRSLIAAGDTELKFYDTVMKRYIELFKADSNYMVKAYDGIICALDALKAAGIKIAVFTNKHHDNAIKVLDTVFGKNYFDFILGQSDSHEKKPSPEGAYIIMKELGVKKEECLYFGDTSVDMKTGRNAGIKTVGVTWGFRKEEELRENGADVIISSAEEIVKLSEVDV